MTQRGVRQVEMLKDDAVCPGCDYALRGLQGDVVTCPECGQTIDLVRLLAIDWNRPWYDVPGFESLLLPLVWPMIGGLAALVAWGLAAVSNETPWLGASFLIVTILGWALSIWRRRAQLDNGSAIALIFLAHGLTVGYLAAMAIFGASLVQLFTSALLPVHLLSLLFVVLSAALAVVCRRGEKFIAAQCLKQYLLDTSRDESEPRAYADAARETSVDPKPNAASRPPPS